MQSTAQLPPQHEERSRRRVNQTKGVSTRDFIMSHHWFRMTKYGCSVIVFVVKLFQYLFEVKKRVHSISKQFPWAVLSVYATVLAFPSCLVHFLV